MLDFRSKTKRTVPNYLGRREQWRLLLLVMLLGLTAIVARTARDPWNWRWMGAGDGVNQRAVHDADRGDVDTRLRRSPATAEALDVVVIRPPADAVAVAPEVGKKLLPGVREEWLATIRDDTVLRGAEHEALYSLLKLLDESDERALADASRGQVSYLQLFRQPDEYRGELVALRGTVRQAVYRQAAANQQEIEGFYKLVLSPDDHPSGVIFVDCLDVPQGFPTGEQVSCEVELTGLLYKRWAYAAQDGIRTAPLLLAKTITWTDAPAPATEPAANWTGIVGSTIVAAIACLFVVVWVVRRPRSRARVHAAEPDHGDVARHLAGLEAAMAEGDASRTGGTP